LPSLHFAPPLVVAPLVEGVLDHVPADAKQAATEADHFWWLFPVILPAAIGGGSRVSLERD
jgi:hypothetical protein